MKPRSHRTDVALPRTAQRARATGLAAARLIGRRPGMTRQVADALTLTTPPSGAPTTSGYDPNGNLALEVTGSARTTMTWDGENRLTRLELPDGTTEENVYRADGLRHKHVDSGGTIHPIWDEQNVLLEKNADFATQAIYTQLPGIWGGAFSFKRGATHYFLLPDLQGHTRQTVNASEALLASYYYDAWGREVWPIVGGGLYLRPFGQWGYWRDTASVLYVGARHLATAQNR
ncbi:MAG: hypothetical protein FJX72_04040 [Armatimonadetes bacterium]|nr:hypothetical protein [Armatimonadota bacterium]